MYVSQGSGSWIENGPGPVRTSMRPAFRDPRGAGWPRRRGIGVWIDSKDSSGNPVQVWDSAACKLTYLWGGTQPTFATPGSCLRGAVPLPSPPAGPQTKAQMTNAPCYVGMTDPLTGDTVASCGSSSEYWSDQQAAAGSQAGTVASLKNFFDSLTVDSNAAGSGSGSGAPGWCDWVPFSSVLSSQCAAGVKTTQVILLVVGGILVFQLLQGRR